MDEQNNLQSNESIQCSKNIWMIAVIMIIIALVVGGGVYAWQKNEVNKMSEKIIQAQKITNEQAKQIMDLKDEIAQIKDESSKVNGEKTTTKENNELSGWTTYVNKNDGYSIMHPSEFWPQSGHNLMNYDINDPRYERGNSDGVKIQIQKHALGSDFKSFDEYVTYQKNISDDFNDPAKTVKLGDFITMSQYTKTGPGGAFMVYTAFDRSSNNYFAILIFEPGYSKNKELIEKIISTFKIL
jgi:hypothetical protein